MRSEFIMKIQSENTPFGILKVDYQIENIFYESKKVYTNSICDVLTTRDEGNSFLS